MTKEIVQTTVRLPRELWLKLRKLEEQEKIKSIHEAILRGLKWVVQNIK